MRIAILTLPLHTNYGGILQAYALQTILERMGHEVEVPGRLYRAYYPVWWKLPLSFGKRILKKILVDHQTIIFTERKYNRELPSINRYTQQFIKHYIHVRPMTSLATIKRDDYDAFVVGSDQVWRPIYFDESKIGEAYLSFAQKWPHVKRISYAASFGTNDWEYTPKQTKLCRKLIQQFDCVTVREDDGVTLCRNIFGVEAHHVLDPTLLLDAADYVSLVYDVQTLKSNGSLLVYVLDPTPQTADAVKHLSKQQGLTPFNTNSRYQDTTAPLTERAQAPVEQWLRAFMDAEYVVTDSFHACAFSIIFNKPFVALGNKGRGMSRFTSLLKLFGLEERLVADVSEVDKLGEIDWTAVNAKRKVLKEKSMQLIKEGLS